LVRSVDSKKIFLSTKNHCVVPLPLAATATDRWVCQSLTLAGAILVNEGKLTKSLVVLFEINMLFVC